jgi:ribonuclease III
LDSNINPVIADLQQRLGVAFRRPALLALALTHSSLAGERPGEESNERLEFLGDSVLGLVVSELLYRAHPEWAEGELTRAKASVVARPALAEVAQAWNLTAAVRVARGEALTGGRTRPALLADTVEAIIAALYLDRGLVACRELIERSFAQRIKAANRIGAELDYKTYLQERLLREHHEPPRYEVLAEEGPPHARNYRVAVRFRDELLGIGEGPSKKEAAQVAAAAALGTLPVPPLEATDD